MRLCASSDKLPIREQFTSPDHPLTSEPLTTTSTHAYSHRLSHIARICRPASQHFKTWAFYCQIFKSLDLVDTKIFKRFIFIFCVWVFTWMYVSHMQCPWRPEEGIRVPELKLQSVVSHFVGAGLVFKSSERAAGAFNIWAISPAPTLLKQSNKVIPPSETSASLFPWNNLT